MLRNFLNSSTQIIFLLGTSLEEIITALAMKKIEESKAAVKITTDVTKIAILEIQNLTRGNEYSSIPEPNDDKLSHSEDPLISQLLSLLDKKEFNILIRVAKQALNSSSSCSDYETRLEQLDNIEEIIKRAEKTYNLFDSQLEYLCKELINKKTALLSEGFSPGSDSSYITKKYR